MLLDEGVLIGLDLFLSVFFLFGSVIRVVAGEFDWSNGERRNGSSVADTNAGSGLLRTVLCSWKLSQERMQYVLLGLHGECLLLLLSGRSQRPSCASGAPFYARLISLSFIKKNPFFFLGEATIEEFWWKCGQSFDFYEWKFWLLWLIDRVLFDFLGLADKDIFLPQCGEGERDSEIHRHLEHSDIHHQQCEGGVPQWEATGEAWEGSDQHLWDLLQKSPWLLQILLYGLQGDWWTLFFLCSTNSKNVAF